MVRPFVWQCCAWEHCRLTSAAAQRRSAWHPTLEPHPSAFTCKPPSPQLPAGDYCYVIAETFGIALETLQAINPQLNCELIQPSEIG